MSKVQIEKDFKELMPGGNSKVKTQEYFSHKKKEMTILVCMALFLMGISFYLELQAGKPEENTLQRNGFGEGKKEIALEVKVNEEDWKSFLVVLEEKEY